MQLTIKGAGFVDVLKGELVEKTLLSIENGLISRVEPYGTGGTDAVDLSGYTLLPGLIDCHVHLTSSGVPERSGNRALDPDAAKCGMTARATDNMRRQLAGGVTTVRDLGAPNAVIFTLRDAERAGEVVGPRIVASGACVTTTNGHGWAGGLTSDTAAEVRKSTRAQLRDGADVIKIMSSGGVFTLSSRSDNCQYTVEELHECVVEAEKMGKRVATHVHAKFAIKSAILAGIHSIEHGIFLDEECIELMLERDTYLVSTLAPHRYIWGNPEIDRIPKVFLDKARVIRDPNFQGVVKAIKAGVKLATGTDSGIPFMQHGRVVTEVETLHELGLSKIDAIRAATLNAADLLQIGDSTGAIREGKIADLVVVEGNPLEDLTVLRNPAMVIHNGKIVAANQKLAVHAPFGAQLLVPRGNWPEWSFDAAN